LSSKSRIKPTKSLFLIKRSRIWRQGVKSLRVRRTRTWKSTIIYLKAPKTLIGNTKRKLTILTSNTKL